MIDKYIFIKTPSALQSIDYSNKLVHEFLGYCKNNLKVGISKKEIEEWFIKFCEKYNVVSAFLGYKNFPNYLCISVNNEIIHGLTSNYELQNGDIVTLDVGINYNGYISDNADTFIIGEPSLKARRLVDITYNALFNTIKNIKPFMRLYDLSTLIYKEAQEHNLYVLQNFGGHGVGYFLHEKPSIPNIPLNIGINWRLRPGMVIAIEPIFLLDPSNIYIMKNNWTLKSDDLSAHTERSIVILTDECKILGK